MARNNSSQRSGLWISIAIAAVIAITGILVANRSTRHRAAAALSKTEQTSATTNSFRSKTISRRAEPLVQFSLPEDRSDEALLAWARGAITNSPQQLLAWAESQSDETLRERVISALLRAWGEKNPRAAVDWALAQEESIRFSRMEAVLRGVAADPTTALEIGRELLRRDSAYDNSYGAALVLALSAAGNFETALQFAKDNPEHADADWFRTTFQRWAEVDPQAAFKALGSIEKSSFRDAAFRALVTGWADRDYSALAEFATSLPTGSDRFLALDTAMSHWCLQNPATLGVWLNNQPASPELDKTVANLITQTDSENRSSEVAMSWVEGIHDTTLRREALLHVMREWIEKDSASAWKYFDKLSWLSDSDRAAARKEIETPKVVVEAD